MALVGGGFVALGFDASSAANWNDDVICREYGVSMGVTTDRTRGGNCQDYKQSAMLSEQLAIFGLVAGGVIAATSAILLLVPSKPTGRAGPQAAMLDCTDGPGAIGLSCALRF